MRAALGTFKANHGYGGFDGPHIKIAEIPDRFDYMRFSDDYDPVCFECGPEHPDHRHHALDHPGTHDHDHNGTVDEHGVPADKPDHTHDNNKPSPPQENLFNRDIALNIRHQDPYFEWVTDPTLPYPGTEPHPDHRHHALDHPHMFDHDHDFKTKNKNLGDHDQEIPEPDHTHKGSKHVKPEPESVELANFYRYGGTDTADFNKYTWEDRKTFPPQAHSAPYPEDLYYRDYVLQDFNTVYDRNFNTNYYPHYDGVFQTYAPF